MGAEHRRPVPRPTATLIWKTSTFTGLPGVRPSAVWFAAE
jgi:hypothetical protein